MDKEVITRNLHLIAEALACSIYELKNKELCVGNTFSTENDVTYDSVNAWMEELTARPRSAPFVLGSSNPTVDLLKSALKTYPHDVKGNQSINQLIMINQSINQLLFYSY